MISTTTELVQVLSDVSLAEKTLQNFKTKEKRPCVRFRDNRVVNLLIFIYTASVKIVSRRFTEPQGLTEDKQQWQEKLL